MTSPAAFPIAVEMAFGYGPGDDPDAIPAGDWVDVTEHIEADQSSAVVTTMQGRTEVGAGISPGDATIELENLGGRFDPRNTAGPYFGDLTIGTPVRVRLGGSDVASLTVAVGDSAVMTSPDGITWTSRTAAVAANWQAVADGAGLFVAVGGDKIMTSPDGITWTERTGPVGGSWSGVAHGAGVFVAVGNSSPRVATSPDGITWTSRTPSETNNWVAVTYAAGLFVAVATSGTNRVMTSPDGITWTARSAPASSWRSVTYAAGLFVAVAQSGTDRAMTSPDGITWTARTIPASTWRSVVHADGLFVAVASAGTDLVATSPDGITWTARTISASSWTSVSYVDELFVAAAEFGADRVATSPDGITWTARTVPVEAWRALGTRVSVSTTTNRWAGFVRSGFPQRFTDTVPGVTVDAHDLFGLAAQGDAPVTAFDATVAGLAAQPDHWWTPTADGWEDRITGRSGRHTGAIVPLDPAIDGAQESWGMESPDGWGTIEHAAARLDTSTQSLMVAARFRLPPAAERIAATPPETTARTTLISQAETTLGASWFTIEVEQSNLFIDAITESERRTAQVGIDRSSLFDGRAHTILVYVPAGTGPITVHVDGVQLETTTDTVPTAVSLEFGPLYIGTAGPASGVAPYQGVIDPVIVWRNHPGTGLDTLAATLRSAATVAWAGERLDQRLVRLADSTGLGNHLGEFDVSGVLTLQGYRQGQTVELFQTVEETEQGRVWVDRNGRLRFAQRGWAWTDEHSTAVQMTFTDDPDLLDDTEVDTIEIGEGTVLRDSELDLVNVAAVTSTNGRQQIAEDATSFQRTGRRNAVQLSNLLHPSDRQSLAIAQWIIYSQSDSPLRVDQITFRVDEDPDVAGPFAKAVDLGWLLRLVKAAPVDCDGDPIGDPIDVSGHVIGIRNEFSFQGWDMTLWVDCTRANRSWFEIGASELGGTDPLAF